MTDEYDDLGEEAYWDNEIEKLEKAVIRRQQKHNAAAAQQFFNASWQEALNEAGLTPVEYQQLVSLDPQGVAQVVRDGMKRVTKTVAARKRDPKTGRFVAGQSARPAQPTAPPKVERSAQGPNEGLLGQDSTGGDEDIDKALDTLLPDNDPLFRV
ncbi:MAG: hypothetical protein SWH78_17655 [Thermodesulfobacteriota bacterium]|nr:hypothetical protein [Thermodesulfobacteriota bacterium]